MRRPIASAIAALSLFQAQANAFPASGGTPVPAAARTAGYTTLTFATDRDFNTATVDMATTYASGFQWYAANFFGQTPDTSGITLHADGSVSAINGVSDGNLASVGQIVASPYFVGTAFGCGLYMEAEVAYDPSALDLSVGWPSWWSMALEHMVHLPGQQWIGQAAGYDHFIELDTFEALRPVTAEPFVYSGAAHDWYGIFGSTCPPGYCDVVTDFLTAGRVEPPGSDAKLFHKYAALWIPATGSSSGSMAFFYDDVQLGPATTWTQFTTQSPPATGQPWAFGVIDQQHLVLIFGQSGTSPINVRSVRVWQGPGACNLTN